MTDKDTAREVVIRTVEAMRKLDTTSVTADFAENIVWELAGGEYFEGGDSWAGGRRWTGRDSVISDFVGGVFGKAFDFNAPFELEVTGVHGDGPSIPVEFTMSATTTQGRSYNNHYCVIFTVVDGSIIHAREYTNTLLQKRVLVDS